MFKAFKNHCTTHFISSLRGGTRFFEQFLYPLKCLKCGVYIDPDMVADHTMEACFCDQCMADGLYLLASPYCTKCGVKFQKSFDENHVCEACLKTPLLLSCVRAAVEYKGITKDAIPLFKYQSKLSMARAFEALLFQAFLHHYEGEGIDLILPVPLHRKKLRQRGFNQAFLLIRNFVKLYGNAVDHPPSWKIDTVSLARIKKTDPQTGFDVDQRKTNLKNAFKVVNQEAIENRHILLIDDVFTTGATCNEAARVLLKHGAKKVDALVLART